MAGGAQAAAARGGGPTASSPLRHRCRHALRGGWWLRWVAAVGAAGVATLWGGGLAASAAATRCAVMGGADGGGNGKVAAAAAATAAAAAAVATRTVLPFPSPRPENATGAAVPAGEDGGEGAPPPRLGRFHTLPSLACVVREAGTADGCRRVTPVGGGMVRPLGDRTCAAPLGMEGVLDRLVGFRPAAAVLANCTETAATVGTWRGDPLHDDREGGGEVWERASKGQYTVGYSAVSGSDGSGGALSHEGRVARLLTLQRHSMGGSVMRQANVFDAVAVSRLTQGVCQKLREWDDQGCPGGMFPVDSSQQLPHVSSGDKTYLPMVTYKNPDGNLSVVTECHAGLLSLGRAVMVDPGWLGGKPAWRSSLKNEVSLRVYPGEKDDVLPTGWPPRGGVVSKWDLKRSGGSTSSFLSAIAYVLCEPPAFMLVPDWLCVGIPPSSPPSRSADEQMIRPAIDQTVDGTKGRSAMWDLYVVHSSRAGNGDLTLTDELVSDVRRPCWVAGLGSREINPGSPDEAALARRIGTTYFGLPAEGEPHRAGWAATSWGPFPTGAHHERVQRVLRGVTQAYDRSMFGAPAPLEPADDGSVLLAVIVVFPELVALVVLFVTTWPWRRQDLCIFLFVFISGLVSMAGILSLAIWEVQGARWSAATVRNELWTEENGVNTSTYAVRTETLIIVTRLGFRPQLLLRIAIGSVVGYVGLSGIVMGAVWALRQRGHGQSDGDDLGSGDGSGTDGGAGAHDASGGGLPPRGITSSSRRSRRGLLRWRLRRTTPRKWQHQRGGSALPPLPLATHAGQPAANSPAPAVDATALAAVSLVQKPPESHSRGLPLGGPAH